MTDWPTIASLSTAGGTLVLAIATFSSVRSANRAARAAEESLLAGLRPLLVPSRPEDAPEKVGFVDDHWVMVPGGGATAEATDDAVYLAMSLRNVGSGIAVLDRWSLRFGAPRAGAPIEHADPEKFRRLNRDLYIAPGDRGFWQGAIRDSADDLFDRTHAAIAARERLIVELLYGDYEGGQRMISWFSIVPSQHGGWILVSVKHWNLDRPDPR